MEMYVFHHFFLNSLSLILTQRRESLEWPLLGKQCNSMLTWLSEQSDDRGTSAGLVVFGGDHVQRVESISL